MTRKNSIFDKWIRKPLKIQWFWDEKLIFLFYFISYISISVLYHNREEEHCMRFQHTTVLTSMSPNYDSSVLSPLKNLKLQDQSRFFEKYSAHLFSSSLPAWSTFDLDSSSFSFTITNSMYLSQNWECHLWQSTQVLVLCYRWHIGPPQSPQVRMIYTDICTYCAIIVPFHQYFSSNIRFLTYASNTRLYTHFCMAGNTSDRR